MDEQSQPEMSTDTTVPEAINTNDDTLTATESPVDTLEGAEPSRPEPTDEGEIQVVPKDEQAKEREKEEPEIIEDAGVGEEVVAGDKPEGTEPQEEDDKEDAVGEEPATPAKPSNPKSAMVLLMLLEGDEKLLERKVQ